MPHDEKWFHSKLPSEVTDSLKPEMDVFCVELYGEHLPELSMQSDPSASPILQ
jgi:hypothetical protein